MSGDINLAPSEAYTRVSQVIPEIIGASEILIYWSMGAKSEYLAEATTIFPMHYNFGVNYKAETIVEVNKQNGNITFAYSEIGNSTVKPKINMIYYR